MKVAVNRSLASLNLPFIPLGRFRAGCTSFFLKDEVVRDKKKIVTIFEYGAKFDSLCWSIRNLSVPTYLRL